MGKYNDESRRHLYLIKEPFGLAKKLFLIIIATQQLVIGFLLTDDIRFIYTAPVLGLLVWLVSEWVHGIYKIGITSNLENRLRQINNGNARRVFYVFTRNLNKAGVVETKIHRRFKQKRREGEWFGLYFWEVGYLWVRYFF